MAPQALRLADCAVRSVLAIELQVGICGGHFAEHLFVAGDGQLGEVFADAFDGDAEHGGEIFFVAEQDVDLARRSRG